MEKDRRKEIRHVIDSVNLPFLGSKEEDHLCFQYLLIDVNKTGMRIAIPRWVVSREQIRKGDIVSFYLPDETDESFCDRGRIIWIEWNESMEAQVCGASLESSKPIQYPVSSMSKEDMVIRLMKDCVLLKKGVYIYLGHLIPYFSRITGYSREEYPQLKAYYLEDVRIKVMEHHIKLDNIHKELKSEMRSASEIPKLIDLEELRALVESEIYVEVFKITFSDERIEPYLNAIKKLEDRLYLNYNIIVKAFIKAL